MACWYTQYLGYRDREYKVYDVEITEYREDFDKKLGLSLLHFAFTTDAVTGIDNRSEQKLNNLFDTLKRT